MTLFPIFLDFSAVQDQTARDFASPKSSSHRGGRKRTLPEATARHLGSNPSKQIERDPCLWSIPIWRYSTMCRTQWGQSHSDGGSRARTHTEGSGSSISAQDGE